jgi:uncharacterized protein (TIGR03083 family)
MPTAEDLLPPSTGTPGGLLTEVCDALHAELAALSDDGWSSPVIFDWTVRDVVAHLAAVNELLVARLRADERAPVDPAQLLDATHAAQRELRDASHDQISDRWCRSVADLQTSARHGHLVGWVGLTIPTCSAVVDRAFEAWIHANDIRHAIGRASLDPSAQSFRVLSDLAAQLLPRALVMTGREHSGCLQLVLSGAGGGEWTMALGDGPDHGPQVMLSASARDLCLLMGDRIDPRDFAYTVRGDEGAAEIAADVVHAASAFARP